MPSAQQVHHATQDMLYLKDKFYLVFVPLWMWQFRFDTEGLEAYPACGGGQKFCSSCEAQTFLFFDKDRHNLIPIWKILVKIKPLIGLNAQPNHV